MYAPWNPGGGINCSVTLLNTVLSPTNIAVGESQILYFSFSTVSRSCLFSLLKRPWLSRIGIILPLLDLLYRLGSGAHCLLQSPLLSSF